MIPFISSACVVAVIVLGMLIMTNALDMERLTLMCRKVFVISLVALLFACVLRESIRPRVTEIKALLVWITTITILMIIALVVAAVMLLAMMRSRAKARGKGEEV